MLKESDLLKKFESETGIPANEWSKRGSWSDTPMAVLDPTMFGVEEGKIPITGQMIPYLSNWYYVRVNSMGKHDKDNGTIEVIGKTIYAEPLNRSQRPYCWNHPEQELAYLSSKIIGHGKNRRETRTHPYCLTCEGDEKTIRLYRTFIQNMQENKKPEPPQRKRILKLPFF